jgi:hypothetical protein
LFPEADASLARDPRAYQLLCNFAAADNENRDWILKFSERK